MFFCKKICCSSSSQDKPYNLKEKTLSKDIKKPYLIIYKEIKK